MCSLLVTRCKVAQFAMRLQITCKLYFKTLEVLAVICMQVSSLNQALLYAEYYYILQLSSYSLAFYPGGVVESYCSSEGNSLHFNGQFLGSYLSTLEYHITADTFMQFDLITTCASNTALQYYIKLEYSKDGGLTWEVVSIAQEGFRNQYL